MLNSNKEKNNLFVNMSSAQKIGIPLKEVGTFKSS